MLSMLMTTVLLAGAFGAPPAVRQDLDNVVIVLDASGSMKKSMNDEAGTIRIDAAKLAIARVLKTVPDTTHAGLLVFSNAVQNPWVFPLGPRNDRVLEQRLLAVKPDGGTPLGQFIKIGADRLLEQREAQHGYGTFRLLVVTDGRADDGDLVETFLPDILARGIVIDVIGVSMRDKHALATEVHSYRRADDPESLTRAIETVFAEVSSDGADDNVLAAGFELLEGLPDGVALPIIASLSRVNNGPIGSVPEERRVEPNSVPLTTGGEPADQRPAGGGPLRTLLLIGVAALVVFALASRRRRRHRRGWRS